MAKKKKASVGKSKGKFTIKEGLEYFLEILKGMIIPGLLNGLKEKLHDEIKYITDKFEHKANKVIMNATTQIVYAFMMIIALVFLIFGIFYLATDIIGIARAYVLLGLGIIIILIVILKKPKLKTE